MADKALAVIGLAVDGEGDITGGAGGGVTTVTEEKGGETAAVEEEDRLIFAVESFGERLDQRRGEELARASDVDKFDLGEFVDRPEL